MDKFFNVTTIGRIVVEVGGGTKRVRGRRKHDSTM